MNYKIESNKLLVFITPEERQQLRAMMDEDGFDSDQTMHDVLEALICNSELTWIEASITADLTSAPMLAILGDEQPGEGGMGSWLVHVGCWTDKDGNLRQWYQPVLHRWAFMDYQITSPQRQLAESGVAEFEGE